MALTAGLDKIQPVAFESLSMVNARDVIKEILGCPNDGVMEKEIERLNQTQQDTLMKVIYLGLAKDSRMCTQYLKWHAALYSVTGAGAIIRTLADKPPIQ